MVHCQMTSAGDRRLVSHHPVLGHLSLDGDVDVLSSSRHHLHLYQIDQLHHHLICHLCRH